MNEIEFKLSRKDSYQKDALFWIKLANDRLGESNRQLLGLATILLPLTASIIALDIDLREFQKTLLILSWLFLFFSILSGLVQLFIDADYFRLLSRDSSKREVIWADFTKKVSELENATKKLGYTPSSGTHIPIAFQVFTILTGITLIMIVAATLLISK